MSTYPSRNVLGPNMVCIYIYIYIEPECVLGPYAMIFGYLKPPGK